MFDQFVNSLAGNLADILTIAVLVAIVGGITLYLLARHRHVKGIKTRLGGQVEIPGKIKETLAKAMNSDVAEAGTIGAISFVDLAWYYSMADPSIWDAFHGPAAEHMSAAMQNLDVLHSALGDSAFPMADHVVTYLRSLEALHVFGDLIDKIPVVGGAAIALEAKTSSLVDSLIGSAALEGKATGAEAALTLHIPLVTIGFASYRAWRRSQKGASLGRNAEFAAIEVSTRAGGGLLGGKVGGVVGTAIAPGPGTIIGAVTGAVAGAVGGAVLGETFKKRHVQKAQRGLDETLDRLGAAYLDDATGFEQVTGVFRAQEDQYESSLGETRRRLRRYSMPWRLVWPDEKLVLLRETVHLAQQKLETVRTGTVEALDRLTYMRLTGQRREMGLMLLGNPALCESIPADEELLAGARAANEKLTVEYRHLGAPVPA